MFCYTDWIIHSTLLEHIIKNKQRIKQYKGVKQNKIKRRRRTGTGKDLVAVRLHGSKMFLKTVYWRNILSWYSNSKLFFFFSNGFLFTESLLNSRETHPVSNVEYILFSVARLHNSTDWSFLEFEFRVDFLPYSFCSKMLSEIYSLCVRKW